MAKHGVHTKGELEKTRKEKEALATKRKAAEETIKFVIDMLYH